MAVREPQVEWEQPEEEEKGYSDHNSQVEPAVIPTTSQETGKKEVLPLLPSSLKPPPWQHCHGSKSDSDWIPHQRAHHANAPTDHRTKDCKKAKAARWVKPAMRNKNDKPATRP